MWRVACPVGHKLRGSSLAEEYIEQRNGRYVIAGTRVSLDLVVHAFLRGESPEGIAESFPALNRGAHLSARAFYMANREMWIGT